MDEPKPSRIVTYSFAHTRRGEKQTIFQYTGCIVLSVYKIGTFRYHYFIICGNYKLIWDLISTLSLNQHQAANRTEQLDAPVRANPPCIAVLRGTSQKKKKKTSLVIIHHLCCCTYIIGSVTINTWEEHIKRKRINQAVRSQIQDGNGVHELEIAIVYFDVELQPGIANAWTLLFLNDVQLTLYNWGLLMVINVGYVNAWGHSYTYGNSLSYFSKGCHSSWVSDTETVK